MTSATLYPFSKCPKGHDLTGEDAFIYDKGGNRACRMCRSEEKRGKRTTEVRGAFDGGNA
jgi:hypothetical protein